MKMRLARKSKPPDSLQYIVCASREHSDETAQTRSLVWVFVVSPVNVTRQKVQWLIGSYFCFFYSVRFKHLNTWTRIPTLFITDIENDAIRKSPQFFEINTFNYKFLCFWKEMNGMWCAANDVKLLLSGKILWRLPIIYIYRGAVFFT